MGTTRSARTPTVTRPLEASWTTCSVPDRRGKTPAVETPAVPCRSAPAPPGPRLALSAGASAVASPTIPGSTPGSPRSGTGLTRLWRTTETTQQSRLFRPDTSKVLMNYTYSEAASQHYLGPSVTIKQPLQYIKCCIIQLSFCQHFVTKLTPKITFL